MGYIYRIENTITEKFYIGQTTQSIETRWGEHKKHLRGKKHGNAYLQAAWNKYGEDNFRFEVMLECPDETLNFWEKAILGDGWKSHNDYCYNLREGGSKGKLSQETKRKISKAHKGKSKSPKEQARLRKLRLGKKLSQEQKEKISKGLKGKALGKNNGYAVGVIMTLANGEELVFDTLREASVYFGVREDSISKALKRGGWGENYQTPKRLHNAKIQRIK